VVSAAAASASTALERRILCHWSPFDGYFNRFRRARRKQQGAARSSLAQERCSRLKGRPTLTSGAHNSL
jgi:hypothetical protein